MKVRKAAFQFMISTTAVLFVLATMVGIYAAMPSERFLDVDALIYDTEANIGTIRRTTPYGPVLGRWHTEATTADGLTCQAPPEFLPLTPYSSERSDVARFPIHPDLRPCMTGKKPVFVAERWTVYLWGWLPLIPTEIEVVVP